MKISELPEPYKALAESRRGSDPSSKIKDNLSEAFRWSTTAEGMDFWRSVNYASTPAELPPLPEATAIPASTSPFATIPSPETLRPLLEAALAVMDPNDPAKAQLNVRACLPSDGAAYFSASFYCYNETPSREAYGSGQSPEAALENFKAKYTPPPTVENRIAALRAELAKLEGTR